MTIMRGTELDWLFSDHCRVREDSFGVQSYSLAYDEAKAAAQKLGRSGASDDLWATWRGIFPGGFAMAEYITRNPDQFQGKTVVDLGAGSGIVSIVAARAGAKAIAVDCNEIAVEAIRRNAALNQVDVTVIEGYASSKHAALGDIVMGCDMEFFRERKGREGIASSVIQMSAGKELYMASIGRESPFHNFPDIEWLVKPGAHQYGAVLVYMDQRELQPQRELKTAHQPIAAQIPEP